MYDFHQPLAGGLLNTYEYVGASPLNYADFQGLSRGGVNFWHAYRARMKGQGHSREYVQAMYYQVRHPNLVRLTRFPRGITFHNALNNGPDFVTSVLFPTTIVRKDYSKLKIIKCNHLNMCKISVPTCKCKVKRRFSESCSANSGGKELRPSSENDPNCICSNEIEVKLFP